MTNEERKSAILELWHDIATDRSLQVGLRLKASEYEAKALGLIGDQPGISVESADDPVETQLEKLTLKQLQAIATASDEKIANAKKTTAQKRVCATSKTKNDTAPASKAKTPVTPQKSPNTDTAKKGGQK